MTRRSSKFLEACPGAAYAYEHAQRIDGEMEAWKRSGDHHRLFERDPNTGETRWLLGRAGGPRSPLSDLTEPQVWETQRAIVNAEASARIVRSLEAHDLHLLSVSKEQLHALPEITATEAWGAIALDEERPPFENLWVETPGFELATRQGQPWKCLGFLISDTDDYLCFQTIFESRATSDLELAAASRARRPGDPFLREPGKRTISAGLKTFIPRHPHALLEDVLDSATIILRRPTTPEEFESAKGDAEHDAGFVIEACRLYNSGDNPHRFYAAIQEAFLPIVAGLLLLFSSINVEVKKDTASLPREARRAVKRGAVEPDVLWIDAPKIRAPREPREGEPQPGRKLTKRHEVRGHFKHFGPETRQYQNAPAAKQREHPVIGPHVRFWTRPHVRGPADAPLVIKPRRLRNQREKGDDQAAA